MAKEKNSKAKVQIALASFLVIAVGVISAIVTYGVTNTHQTADNAQAVESLKLDGCDVSNANELTISSVETKMDMVIKKQDKQEERQLEQTQLLHQIKGKLDEP